MPAAVSCATIASRFATRKVSIHCCASDPKYFVVTGNGWNAVVPESWRHGSISFAVGVRATPKFFSYHSARAFESFALKKKPPMPVTFSLGRAWEVATGAEDAR